jgi:hypothetical protein
MARSFSIHLGCCVLEETIFLNARFALSIHAGYWLGRPISQRSGASICVVTVDPVKFGFAPGAASVARMSEATSGISYFLRTPHIAALMRATCFTPKAGQSHGQSTLILSANAAPKLLLASPDRFRPLSFSVLSSSVGLWIVILHATGAPTSLIGSSSCKENSMK